jgi:hypothetical protein
VREVEANRMTARMRLEEAARLDKERDKDLRAALFELSEAANERAGQAEEVVNEIRAEMRRRGFMPPELPPDLDDVARVDQLMTQGESKANDEGGEAL